jgi:hypothetical protein
LAEGAADLPDQHLRDELVDIHFDLHHDKRYALFDPPTFIAEQRMGKAPTFLVLGISALVARFVDPLLAKMVLMVILDSRQIHILITANPGTEGERGQRLVNACLNAARKL